MTFLPRGKHQPQVLWYSEPNGELVDIFIFEVLKAPESPLKKREAVGGRWALRPAAIGAGPDERGPGVDSGVRGDAECGKFASLGPEKVVRKRQDTLGRHGCDGVQSIFANENKDLPIVGNSFLGQFQMFFLLYLICNRIERERAHVLSKALNLLERESQLQTSQLS